MEREDRIEESIQRGTINTTDLLKKSYGSLLQKVPTIYTYCDG